MGGLIGQEDRGEDKVRRWPLGLWSALSFSLFTNHRLDSLFSHFSETRTLAKATVFSRSRWIVVPCGTAVGADTPTYRVPISVIAVSISMYLPRVFEFDWLPNARSFSRISCIFGSPCSLYPTHTITHIQSLSFVQPSPFSLALAHLSGF